MSKDERSGKKEKPVPTPDKLGKSGKKGGAELSERDLGKVAGGWSGSGGGGDDRHQ